MIVGEALATLCMAGLGALVFASVIAIAYTMSQRRREAWVRLGAKHQLDFTDTWTARRLDGAVEGLPVAIWTESRSAGKSRVTYTCVSVSGIPKGIELTQEGMFSAFAKVFSGADIEVGDRAFDDAMHVSGDPVKAAALLDADARQAMLAHPGTQVRADGSVYLEFRGDDADKADGTLQWLVHVAKAFRGPDLRTTAERLERIIREDPNASVRANALRVMLTNLSGARSNAMAREVLAQPDSDDELKFVAARRLGDLEQLRRILGRRNRAGLIESVLTTLRQHQALDAQDAERVAGFLTAKHAGLRMQAIHALGEIAGVDMVERLMPLSGRGPLASAEARAAADAIQAIQGRVVGAAAGTLSMAQMPEQQGTLQVAEPGTEGALQMAPRGQREPEA